MKKIDTQNVRFQIDKNFRASNRNIIIQENWSKSFIYWVKFDNVRVEQFTVSLSVKKMTKNNQQKNKKTHQRLFVDSGLIVFVILRIHRELSRGLRIDTYLIL